MRRWRLSTLLISFNLVTILGAIALVGIVGVTLLRRLADEQALARVRLAGLGAVEAVERTGARLVGSAVLLAERPTLVRLAAASAADELRQYLERFRETSGLSACALVLDDGVVVSAGALPAGAVAAAGPAPPQGPLTLVVGASGELTMIARAAVRSAVPARVVVTRTIDEAYVGETAQKVGLPVRVVSRDGVSDAIDDPLAALQRRALLEDRLAAGRSSDGTAFVAVVPLRDISGATVGLIEASLPAVRVADALGALVRTLVASSLVIAALAVVLSLLIARGLTRPLERLSGAVARIGGGDLASPVPRLPGAEIGTLSASVEEMRGKLLELMTELRRRRAEAEAILEGIVEGVFAVDGERRIRYLNPQAAGLLGIPVEQALGRFCGDVLSPEGPDGRRPCEEQCPILHARFRGNARAREELRLPGGARRAVVVTSAPSGTDAEEPGAAEALQFQVLRDETEVEATRRLRDSILAHISHEFRSPLSAQLASLELLRDRLHELPPRQVRELVLSLERGALRLTRLIDNLLESTRIEAGRDSLRLRRVALDEVIEEAVELMRPLVDQRRQALVLDLPYPLPPVTGDAPRLVQVFVNLLANANKFAPPGTEIGLGGTVRPGEVELWVEDRGPGLPAGAAEAVFERFVRSTDAEPSQSGMGLGLWVVKSIVERHGGRVVARGAEPGTRMSVILPRGGADEDPGR